MKTPSERFDFCPRLRRAVDRSRSAGGRGAGPEMGRKRPRKESG
ncbi:MAG: hypothetical protein HSCHL_0435 [Hydrogenibacillus schlegelii]|uniref:Uncharacterized protein n=1 Tax=Hydrogenibacillus schlegelii TaxID=1484 RepID=A0A2T5G3H0_HYDSH|nr:MAG: hypothetical protein HSCHL_0435 [Hydrogenibacillus schlegelii]